MRFLIVFLFLANTVFGQKTVFVIAENGLTIRKNASLKSEKIGSLDYGKEVLVKKATGEKIEIKDGKKIVSGSWVEVEEIIGSQKGFVFSGYLTKEKPFTLIKPNVSKLKNQVKLDDSIEVLYQYLLNNYQKKGEKYALEHYDWDTTILCSFTQDFENRIKYSVFECKEAGGVTIEVEFPKINRKYLRGWIEEVYKVMKVDADENIWKENGTKFEPKETVPGCYYKIVEKEKSTLVELYCGC